jgi:hypothetical protein
MKKRTKWQRYEAAKQKLDKLHLPRKEYEKAVQDLCRKYRI